MNGAGSLVPVVRARGGLAPPPRSGLEVAIAAQSRWCHGVTGVQSQNGLVVDCEDAPCARYALQLMFAAIAEEDA